MASPIVDASEALERPFDFSKLPNLREVVLGVSWIGGPLHWIPAALSTLRLTTSPRLSTVQLNFIHLATANRSAIYEAGDDLRHVEDEVTRIGSEFRGAVTVIVFRDPAFQVALDMLNVRFHFRGMDDTLYPC